MENKIKTKYLKNGKKINSIFIKLVHTFYKIWSLCSPINSPYICNEKKVSKNLDLKLGFGGIGISENFGIGIARDWDLRDRDRDFRNLRDPA
jgi:hypothetical protein